MHSAITNSLAMSARDETAAQGRDDFASVVPSLRDLKGKTVLVPLRYGLMARNILRGGFINVMREAGVKLVVVCPAAGEQYLIDELRVSDVVLEPYPDRPALAVERLWRNVVNVLMFDNPAVTKTMRLKWLEDGLQRGQYGKFVGRALAALLQLYRSALVDALCGFIDFKAFRYQPIEMLLKKYRPDLVMATHLFGPDNDYIAEAKRAGIPTIGVVKSWDNLTSKTRIRVKPDQLLVWSDHMADEAVQLHHFQRDTIHVVGAPQFDIYRRFMPQRTREEFCRQHGIDPSKKIILYSPGVKFTFSDLDNIRVLHDVISAPDFPVKCHIHVRKYPKKQQDYSQLERDLGITTENAGRVVPSWDDGVDQSEDEVRHLCELVSHANVLVQFGSTIAIDAFCCDVPVIGYNLDRHHPSYRWYSYVSRVHECTHNNYIVDASAVRMAETREQLDEVLRCYLRDSTVDAGNRQAILSKLVGPIDGRAGERIALRVVAALADNHGSRSTAVVTK